MATCLSGMQRKFTSSASLGLRLSTPVVQILRSRPGCPGGGCTFHKAHFTQLIGKYDVLQFCGVYYWMWIVFLPWLGGYTLVGEVERMKDGALTTRLMRKYHASAAGANNGERQPLLGST
jgi:hypothetical protein